MSNIVRMFKDSPDEDARLQEASDWVAKIDRELDAEEIKAFQAWMHEDSRNMEVMFEAAKMWDKLEQLSRLSEIVAEKPHSHSQSSKWWLSIAASLILFCSILVITLGDDNFLGSKNMEIVEQNFKTKIGETNTIYLSDSSSVVLNTNSEIVVRYSDDNRLIELIRGELNIDVAHDPDRILSVVAGGSLIQAVGTSFNVEYKKDEVELIVTEGKVLVDSFNATDVIPKLTFNSIQVAEGQKIDLGLQGTSSQDSAQLVSKQEIESKLSWQKGMIVFRGDTLNDVMTEIERYTDVKFELVNDKRLNNIQIAGVFKTGDVDGLLSVLETSFNVKHERLDAKTFKLSMKI